MKKRLLSVLSLILSFSIFFCSVPVCASNIDPSKDIVFDCETFLNCISLFKGICFSADPEATYKGLNTLYKSAIAYKDSGDLIDYVRKHSATNETTGDITIDASANACISNVVKQYKEKLDNDTGTNYYDTFAPNDIPSCYFDNKKDRDHAVATLISVLNNNDYAVLMPNYTIYTGTSCYYNFCVIGLSSNCGFVSNKHNDGSIDIFYNWSPIHLHDCTECYVGAYDSHGYNLVERTVSSDFVNVPMCRNSLSACPNGALFTRDGLKIKAYKTLADLKAADCNERPYYITDSGKFESSGSGAQTISKGDMDNSISYSDCNNVVTNYMNSNNTTGISDAKLAELLKTLSKNNSGGITSGGTSSGGSSWHLPSLDFSGLFESAIKTLGSFFQGIIDLISSLLGYIGQAIQMLVDFIPKITKIVPESITQLLTAIFPFIPSEIITCITLAFVLALVGAIISVLKGVFK